MRTPAPNKPQQSVVIHQSEVNSLAFNPFNEWLLRKEIPRNSDFGIETVIFGTTQQFRSALRNP